MFKEYLNNTLKASSKLTNIGDQPIILTAPIVRLYFKRLTEQMTRDLIVLSYNEMEPSIEIQSVGVVRYIMKVKKYIGQTAHEAMAKMKTELGPDAVILNTRTIRQKGFLGFFKKPVVEITAAYKKRNNIS